jgi:hypothetical protein
MVYVKYCIYNCIACNIACIINSVFQLLASTQIKVSVNSKIQINSKVNEKYNVRKKVLTLPHHPLTTKMLLANAILPPPPLL